MKVSEAILAVVDAYLKWEADVGMKIIKWVFIGCGVYGVVVLGS